MSDLSKIALIREMLSSAEKSIRSAHQVLSDVLGENAGDDMLIARASGSLRKPMQDNAGAIVVEGIFDGENMIDRDGKNYPVPANYASKSKLVTGDRLKLTIPENGRFLFKQIGPIERKSLVGPLSFEDGQYKVLAGGKVFRVLLASVTYFRAEVGDEITVLVPANGNSEWAAIEAVLPKVDHHQVEKEDDDFEL